MKQKFPTKPKFQNLVIGRCPLCEATMERAGKVYACTACDYYVPPRKLVEILTNPEGQARKHMTKKQRDHVDKLMKSNTIKS